MTEKIIATIKARIAKNMEAQGLKRYTLAEKAGIANPTIQNWYTNRNYQPSLDSLIKVCIVLNMSLAQICLGEDEMLYPVNDEQKDLLDNYLSLGDEDKELVLTMTKRLRKD